MMAVRAPSDGSQGHYDGSQGQGPIWMAVSQGPMMAVRAL